MALSHKIQQMWRKILAGVTTIFIFGVVVFYLLLPPILQIKKLHQQKNLLKERLERLDMPSFASVPNLEASIDGYTALKRILFLSGMHQIVLAAYKIIKQEDGEEKEYQVQFTGSPNQLLNLVLQILHDQVIFMSQRFSIRQEKTGGRLTFEFMPLRLSSVPLRRLPSVFNPFCNTRTKLFKGLTIHEVALNALKLRGIFGQGKSRVAFIEYAQGQIGAVHLGDKMGMENAKIIGISRSEIQLKIGDEEIMRMQ